jgi:hypothetical protein
VNAAALHALADAADALARLARAAAEDSSDGAELLTLDAATKVAGVSRRVLREAIGARDLAAFGKQRSRTVRRSDLNAWVESRRVKPTAGPVDDDIERRMVRLSRQRRTG